MTARGVLVVMVVGGLVFAAAPVLVEHVTERPKPKPGGVLTTARRARDL